MKAVILAGGEGTRLRPVSSGLPKPMVPILGRPVLEHTLGLLRRNGITQICLTLRFLPSLIAEYFGDGEDFGVELEHRIERQALGTAGAVRSCLDFTGEEDFLVISGDAVCDFDLKGCIERHRASHAEASVLLTSCSEPLEYGLALLGEGGRIERFVEKPGWENVVTDLVNTGIYILSPSVLKGFPEDTPLDFAGDVFPRMLRERRGLYGMEVPGYWCDIGSCESYLRCSMDALHGKINLGGIFSAGADDGGVSVYGARSGNEDSGGLSAIGAFGRYENPPQRTAETADKRSAALPYRGREPDTRRHFPGGADERSGDFPIRQAVSASGGAADGCGVSSYSGQIVTEDSHGMSSYSVQNSGEAPHDTESKRGAAAPVFRCETAIPEDVKLIPPCLIESGVSIARGAVIGPDAVICSGSSIGRHARLEGCVINGAAVGDDAVISGSIVCSGATVGSSAELCPGSVIGPGSSIGSGACVREKVAVFPARRVESGTVLSETLPESGGFAGVLPVFSSEGVLRGDYGLDITPEACARLGAAAAGCAGRIGCGGSGELSLLCCESFAVSARAHGADVFRVDSAFPSEAAFAAALYDLPMTVFFSSDGTEITLFSQSGAPAGRSLTRSLEKALSSRTGVSVCSAGRLHYASGIGEAYVSSAAACAFPGSFRSTPAVSIAGRGAAARTAREVLERVGLKLAPPVTRCASFTLSRSGFALSAEDESGCAVTPEQMLLIAAMLEFECGSKVITAPRNAPAALELLAERFGASVLRGGRDGPESGALRFVSPVLRHGAFALSRIVSAMAVRAVSLRELCESIPRYAKASREIRIVRPRASVMRVLSQLCTESAREFDCGLRVTDQRGSVRIAPSAKPGIITLSGESQTAAAAAELCADFERMIRKAEREV